MTTAKKYIYLPYFLFRFFHPKKSISDLQPFAANLLVPTIFFSTFCMRHYLLIGYLCKMLQIYDKIMKLCQSILKYILVENFEEGIPGNY